MRDACDRHRIGNLSETLALTAFIMEGVPVALPYGGHEPWDFVVKLGGRWQAVQIKTARPRKTSGFSWSAMRITGRNQLHGPVTRKARPCSAEDVDLFVVVHPETGRMWKIPIADIAGKTKHPLRDRYLWKPGSLQVNEPHPQPVTVIPYERRESRLRQFLKGRDYAECPSDVRPEIWEAMRLCAEGMAYNKIAQHVGRDTTTLTGSIERAALRLGWMGEGDLRRVASENRRRRSRRSQKPNTPS